MLHETLSSWRLNAQRYHLAGEQCEHCLLKIFPPRDLCPNCHAPITAPYYFSGQGEIYSFTQVNQPPATHLEQAPYTVALIRLAEGPLVTAMLTDIHPPTPYIGQSVAMVTRVLCRDGDRGTITYGYKFRPLSPQESLAE